MNRNTLIAIIAVCITINLLAGAYVLVNYRQSPSGKVILPTVLSENAAMQRAEAVQAGPDVSSASMTAAGDESSTKTAKKKPSRSGKKQDVIDHLDKYLNFVPASNAVSPDGFNNVFFTVVNSSDFTFDQVVINFKCFLSDGSLWNEKNYVVGPIAPHSRAEQLIPNQSRGHSIKWQTVSITSADLDFSWPE